MANNHASFLRKLRADDPRMPAGNWYPFPPPDVGFYNLRQVLVDGNGSFLYDIYPIRRVYKTNNRLLCMGCRLTKMRSDKGWQFQFLPGRVDGTPTHFRPFVVRYETPLGGGPLVQVERRDVSDQLPTAQSRDEAMYIVRCMPDRWPLFVNIHVEYTETRISS